MDEIEKTQRLLANKAKLVVMLAPSFVSEFNYPDIIFYLKKIGFDNVVELTFGAKLVNKEYHKILGCSNCFLISSVCPGVVSVIKSKYPEYVKNIIPVVSPMVATARLCRKIYPKHKIIFISPCNFKKSEALEPTNSKFIDVVLDYQELRKLFSNLKINPDKKINKKEHFDKFYNDYTKIYPLAGGLSKTVHINGILTKDETKIIDGISKIQKFLNKRGKKAKFLDGNFCIGGCIGGPCLSKGSLKSKKKRLLDYIELAKHERIHQKDKGILNRAKGVSLYTKNPEN